MNYKAIKKIDNSIIDNIFLFTALILFVTIIARIASLCIDIKTNDTLNLSQHVLGASSTITPVVITPSVPSSVINLLQGLLSGGKGGIITSGGSKGTSGFSNIPTPPANAGPLPTFPSFLNLPSIPAPKTTTPAVTSITTPTATPGAQSASSPLPRVIPRIDINSKGLNIVLDSKNNGIIAKSVNGDETSLDISTLDQINTNFANKKVEIGKSGDTYTIKQGSNEASSDLPIVIEPYSRTIKVTTSGGNKELLILPSDTLKILESNKIITSVTSGSTANKIDMTLTEENNQAVFRVNGILNKSFLGIFPIEERKQAIVSAQDGKILHVNESFFTKFFDPFSF